MAKKPALGRGLSALLENASKSVKDGAPGKASAETAVADLPEVMPAAEVGNVAGPISVLRISQIEANPFQPRQEFDPTALRELSQSIKEL